jgi:putative tricarboxylic transport membrane protein
MLMAVVMALASIGIMMKSAELNIGWVQGRGPGAGAWPFWLSAGMLICCIVTLVRWFLKITPESRNLDPFMTSETVKIVGVSAGAILFLLAATHIVGIYLALVFFLLFYLKFVGRHKWGLTIILTIGIPVFVFCLFEWALTIPLPKSITEPWFYPIYDLMYG